MTAPTAPAGTPPRRRADVAARPWQGATRRYDLVKEFVVAFVVVAVLAVALSAVFSSPDDHAVTFATWAKADSADFVSTAATELDGTSSTATYGAPYTSTPGAGQKIGPLPLQRWGGVREPVDTARDFVLTPLGSIPNDPALTAALAVYAAAGPARQQAWAGAYGEAVTKAGDPAKVARGSYGPVPLMMSRLLGLATRGGLEGVIAHENGASTRPTSPSPCCSSPTARTWRTGPAPSTWAATSGA
jgi:hypothetical protein